MVLVARTIYLCMCVSVSLCVMHGAKYFGTRT